MQFEIKNKFTGSVVFTAEITCSEDARYSIKLGLAVKCAVKAGANLAGANLAGANLVGANLAGANLAGAYLADAYLAGANLAGANLVGANLAGANLAGANLVGANLAGANLVGANLADGYLAGAYLDGANLVGANLAGAKSIRLPAYQIPQEGELIVWKSCGKHLLKLLIGAKVKRTATPLGRKCRAQRVKTLEIYCRETGKIAPRGTVAIAAHDGITEYRKNRVTRADRYDNNPLKECTGGIHFFLTREEAEAW